MDEYNRLLEAAQVPKSATDRAVDRAVKGYVEAEENATGQDPRQAGEEATIRDSRTVENVAVSKMENATDLEEASKKYGDQAQEMIRTYSNGQNVEDYDAGYRAAYNMGKSGVPFSYTAKNASVTYLSESQIKAAYNAGKAAAVQLAAQQDTTNKATTKDGNVRRQGVVKGEGVTLGELRKAFNDTQHTAYKVLSTYAEATGIDIVLYRSKADKSGKFTDNQGKFVWRENAIYIDVNAGLGNAKDMNDVAKYTMLRTFAHEFTHFIEKWNPIQYNEFRKVVFDTLTERGENVHDLIEHKQAADKSGKMGYEEASREVVAEAMTDILPDANFVQMLADKHKTIFKKLLEKLKEFAAQLKSYFDSIGTNRSPEANALKEQLGGSVRYIESIVKLFDNIAVQAVENYQAAAEEQKSSVQEDRVQNQARRLSDSDLDAYLNAGNRKNKNKLAAVNSGQKVILTSEREITDFINNSIDKKAGNVTVAYGKVNDRLADNVLKESKGKISIKDHYLELIPTDLQHAYEQHNTAKESGDIDLSRSDFERIPEYLDSFTEVLYAIRYSSGNVRICVSKELDNGHILIIETVSKSRGAIQFKNAIGVSKEKYENEYLNKYKKRAEMPSRGSESSNISLRDSINSDNSIREEKEKVNSELHGVENYQAAAEEQKSSVQEDRVQNQSRGYPEDDNYPTSGVHWGIEAGIISKREARVVWEAIANINKLGYYYPETINGEHIVTSDNAIFFVNSDFNYPLITKIIRFNDEYKINNNYAKELIIDARGNETWHREALRVIEAAYGPGYADQYDFTDYSAYGRKNRSGKRADSRTNNATYSERTIDDEQYQPRTSPLTDSEILDFAANELDASELTEGERDALRIHKERMDKIHELQEQRAELGKLYRKQQFGGKASKNEAEATLNRMNTYDTKIQRAFEEILSLEEKAVFKHILKIARNKTMQLERKRMNDELDLYRDRRKKTETRRKIRNAIKDINKLLNKGKGDRNVKQDMKEMARSAVSSSEVLFMDSYSEEEMLRNGVKTDLTDREMAAMQEAQALQRQIDEEPTGEKYRELQRVIKKNKLKDVFARERARLNRAKVQYVLGDLARLYSGLRDSEESSVREAFSEGVYEHILATQEKLGGTTVKDMSLEQLENVYKMYTMVLTTIRNANTMFNENMKKHRMEYAQQVMAELEALAKKKTGGKLRQTARSFLWNNLKPVYAFERIGSTTLTQLYNNMRAGEDTWARNITEAKEYYLKKTAEYKYDSWDFKKPYEFTSSTGKKFTLYLEQIMSLYAHSRRETSLTHIINGGFVFDSNAKEIVKGRWHLKEDATAYKLSPEIFGDIIKKLTKEQKSFVEEMQGYLSNEMGRKGNEVTMKLYGVELFGEEHYFPIHSAGQYLSKAREADLQKKQGQIRLANSGFTQATIPESKNPIVLSDFTQVWSGHVNEMSMYHAFVLPMEDFRRIYNYRTGNKEGTDSVGIVPSIENAYGKAATRYIDQLYNDLNGGALTDPRESGGKRLVSKFKKASVFASASVVIQQPSAIGRAFALIDHKYFVGSKVDSKRHSYLWKEVKQYAPVAIIKEMGYFDTDTGKSAEDFITAREYHGLKEKAKAVFTDGDYRDSVLSKAPALADELTWCAIWDAVKRETRAKKPNLDVKSEEFLTLAGERFTEVITKTQVYDSVLSRSGFMRSKSGLMSMMTAFMAEPTTSINMLEDALRKGKNGNKKYAAKTIGAVYTSVLLNSVLVSFVYAARDDDEDETYWEKYFSSLSTELLEGINPLTYYPFLKDIWSALQGFDIERADMTLITRLTSAMTSLVKAMSKYSDDMSEEERKEHNKSVFNSSWGVVDEIAALLGIPVRNVRRDINAAFNVVKTIGEDMNGRDTSWGSMSDKLWDSVKGSLPVLGWLPNESKSDKLYDATVNGDTAYVKRLNSTYDTDNALNSAIRRGLRDNDPRIREAAIAWNEGNMDKYQRIAKEIIREKNFSQDNIVMAIRNEADSLLKDDGSSSSGASKRVGLFNMDSFVSAIGKGNSTLAETIRQDIIDTAVLNGKTEAEAEKSFISSAKTNIGQQYRDGNTTRQQTLQYLEKYCDMDSEDAEDVVNEWTCERETGIAYGDIKEAFLSGEISENEVRDMYIDYGGYSEEDAEEKAAQYAAVMKYPELDGIDMEKIAKYEQYGEPAGISTETFRDVADHYNSLVGDRQDDTWAYIDSLPLSREQKDAVHCCIWSPTTVKKAPWNN